MDIISILAAFVTAHPWAMVVVVVLLAMSEALPYFPNVEANNVVQMVTNVLKLLKSKLSLKEVPSQQ
jgi:hypothetical protein